MPVGIRHLRTVHVHVGVLTCCWLLEGQMATRLQPQQDSSQIGERPATWELLALAGWWRGNDMGVVRAGVVVARR